MEDTIPGLKAIKETSRSATPSSDQNASEVGPAEDPSKDEAEWNEKAIGQKTWQRRQQSGEYDSASISFSIKTGTKKSKKAKRNSGQGEQSTKFLFGFLKLHQNKFTKFPKISEFLIPCFRFKTYWTTILNY